MDFSENSVVCRNLSKRFGPVTVLEDLNVEFKKGEFTVLLGPSGCGKTTLLRIIAGLEKPSSGDIFIEGQWANAISAKNRDIAMVFQNYALYPYKTVYDNIAFPLQMRKVPKTEIKKRVLRVTTMLGLNELLQRKPGQLSGGQKQRVALGRAVVREPKVFLMDEPLSNLDAKLRVEMRAEILKLFHRLKTTFIYVTHDQVEAMTMGERIIIIDRGVIQQSGSPRELYTRPANRFVAEFLGSPKMNIIPVTIQGDCRLCFQGVLLGRVGKLVQLPAHGDNLYLGIRPEHIELDLHREAFVGKEEEGLALQGRLLFQEYLGDETILHIEAQGYTFLAKVRGTFDTDPHTLMTMRFQVEHAHLFREEKIWQSNLSD